ncbi:MAG: pseudouridine-5'-phosphate glycosidase [Opitutaceae bacterium]
MTASVRIAPEVADALRRRSPVVALESTLITHGLPPPDNLRTAAAMEAAIRAAGAVPATIAVIGGRPTVGIGAAEIARLAGLPRERVRKCSPRDLPFAMARGEDGATTVAATMALAQLAGIAVFATGGIGGVHRGRPFDVSADLIELSRTPVAVVCSGPKAILDLPATLEVLESYGVPVIGFGTATLPGFYTRSSGLAVDATANSPAEAARIVAASARLGAGRGLLIAVPPPAAHALKGDAADAAIAQAVREADERGLLGRALTPFLLARVAELTDGASLRANAALLENNARVAAEIAAALAGCS